jgi:multicomponent Na+:H+ antiporter subunit G
MTEWISAGLLVLGGFFCFVAGVGIVRLGDIYLRMHAATKAGTLGLALICLAKMVQADSVRHLAEPLIVFLFMIATAPVGAHLIGRAVFRTGNVCSPRTQSDEGCAAFLPKRDEGRRAAAPR